MALIQSRSQLVINTWSFLPQTHALPRRARELKEFRVLRDADWPSFRSLEHGNAHPRPEHRAEKSSKLWCAYVCVGGGECCTNMRLKSVPQGGRSFRQTGEPCMTNLTLHALPLLREHLETHV